MLDKFDYAEPNCPLSGGREFYYPQKDGPKGSIPVDRIIRKVDSLFDKNDYEEAGRLLRYWEEEAMALEDQRGQLSILNELIGFYRKQGDRQQGLMAIDRAICLTEALEQEALPSGATILLNCATAFHAFGKPAEALPLFEKAKAVYEADLPRGDTRFGGLYNNMALTLQALGKHHEAEEAFLLALSVMEEAPGGEPEQAITHINLACLYEEGSPEKIPAALEKALVLLERAEPKNGYYAFVLEKCAPAFRHFGDEETCQRLLKEAERIYAGA